MRVKPRSIPTGALRRARARLRSERGFTMILALGVLMVTALLSAAVFATVQGDATLTRADLNGKRAYSAAQAGLQAYLYALNSHGNSQWWETCSNDLVATPTAVPGTSTGVTYSYKPVTTCLTSDPVGSLIDTATGTLRMEFTGYSGTGCPASSACQQRTIVASLRTLSPLSFLWYTVHETVDTLIGGSTCDRFYRASPGPSSSCDIYWVTGDQMNGPMYTQDQFLINPAGTPTFGRTLKDHIVSEVGTPGADDICASSTCQGDPNILGTRVTSPTPTVNLPSDNTNLLTDAQKHGLVVNGTTTLTVAGNTVTGVTCATAQASQCSAVNMTLSGPTPTPIIYATNVAGCNPSYSPTTVTYDNTIGGNGPYKNDYWGACGDIYVSGSYSSPLTISAGNSVVITGSLTNSTDPTGTTAPTGSATLGLVATAYVRVMHSASPCPNGNPTNNPNVTIDGAILTLTHSFFVDNYDCGGTPLGTLTVHGAIAQFYRGIVGQVGSNGYLKNYNYDNRLGLILPPYLFDLQNTAWTVFRETLCSSAAPASSPNSCSYTGS
jgi:Tfp pilus assembly protein PilX